MSLDKNNSQRVVGYIVPMGKGLDSFVYREIEALNDLGLTIVLFSTKFKKNDIFSPKKEWKYYVLNLQLLAIIFPIILVKLMLHPSLLLHAIKNRSLIHLIFALHYAPRMSKENVRQIHCHFGDHKLFIGYYCKRLTGLPLTVTIHSHELHVNPNVKLFKIALQACDRIFAISELAVNMLVNKYSAPAERVILSKLFLDISVWSNEPPIRVITVGRFEPQKGFDYLFKAAALLSDINIEFVIVGFGPLDLRSMANDYNVANRIVFFEKMGLEQLRLLYQSCDIYCLPSVSHPEQGMEGIPVVLMEAMACGMPIVATNAGAVPEIVETVLVEEKSSESLARAIRELASDEIMRNKQGLRNREIVKENHSVKNVEQLLDGFNDVYFNKK